jgi:hypothetical protein
MTRRGNAAPPISLFSFQDIITSVAGIIIFLTLMMTLELVQQKSDAPVVRTQATAAALKARLPEAASQVRQLEDLLAQGAARLQAAAALTPRAMSESTVDLTRRLESLRQELREIDVQNQDAQRRETSASAQSKARDVDREKAAELEGQIAALKSRLDTLRRTNQLIYSNSATSKAAWLVELSSAGAQAMRLGANPARAAFAADDVQGLTKWMRGLNGDKEYVVLIVKPSGIAAFDEIIADLESFPVEVGYDLIEEQQTAVGEGQ